MSFYETEDSYLNQLIRSKGFMDTIKSLPVISPAQLLLSILKFAFKNSSSVREIEGHLKIVNNIFSTSILFDSAHYIKKICTRNDAVTFYKLCPKCSELIGSIKELPDLLICKKCGENIKSTDLSDNVFAIIDPSEAIKEYIMLYEDHYEFVVKERQHKEGILEDIYDGLVYRNFVDSLSLEDRYQYVSLTLNTDGAQAFESNLLSAWPIYIEINELPLSIRLKSIITCGVWFGESHPPMSQYLGVFLKMMSNILQKGIPCTVKEEKRLLKPHIICSVTDTPARPLMNSTINFHGYYSCDWCYIKGDHFAGCVRFPVENVMKPRDLRSTLVLMLKAKNRNKKKTSILGIKDIAPLAYAKKFNIVRGLVPDYLHIFLLGIIKQNFKYILQSITKEKRELLDKYLMKIKPPSRIGTLPRSITQRGKWKGKEWENFLLYYLIPLLEMVGVDSSIVYYWILLVNGLYILLKSTITYDELNKADEYLREFVGLTQNKYGLRAITSILHQVLHIAASVRDFGPLFAHSTFPFESANFQMVKSIKCAKGVVSQVVRNINLQYVTQILKRHIYPTSPEYVKDFIDNIDCTNISEKYIKVSDDHFFSDCVNIKKGLSSSAKVFKRMIHKKCL